MKNKYFIYYFMRSNLKFNIILQCYILKDKNKLKMQPELKDILSDYVIRFWIQIYI